MRLAIAVICDDNLNLIKIRYAEFEALLNIGMTAFGEAERSRSKGYVGHTLFGRRPLETTKTFTPPYYKFNTWDGHVIIREYSLSELMNNDLTAFGLCVRGDNVYLKGTRNITKITPSHVYDDVVQVLGGSWNKFNEMTVAWLIDYKGKVKGIPIEQLPTICNKFNIELSQSPTQATESINLRRLKSRVADKTRNRALLGQALSLGIICDDADSSPMRMEIPDEETVIIPSGWLTVTSESLESNYYGIRTLVFPDYIEDVDLGYASMANLRKLRAPQRCESFKMGTEADLDELSLPKEVIGGVFKFKACTIPFDSVNLMPYTKVSVLEFVLQDARNIDSCYIPTSVRTDIDLQNVSALETVNYKSTGSLNAGNQIILTLSDARALTRITCPKELRGTAALQLCVEGASPTHEVEVEFRDLYLAYVARYDVRFVFKEAPQTVVVNICEDPETTLESYKWLASESKEVIPAGVYLYVDDNQVYFYDPRRPAWQYTIETKF